MKTIHLGLNTHEEITEMGIPTIASLRKLLSDIMRKNHVYVFAFQSFEKEEIVLVGESQLIITLVNSLVDKILLVDDLFLQEYNSYESAYAVALTMMEVSPICYDTEDEE